MVIRGGQQPHLWVTVRVPNKGCFLQKPYLGTCRDSDINLVELGNDTVKEDDRVVLLEGGTLRSASPISHSSTIASPVVRLITMDESFFLENRLTLRAILEFGLTVFYFYLCDRTNFFAHSTKSYNRNLFLFLYFLLIIVSAITSFKIHHDKSPSSEIHYVP